MSLRPTTNGWSQGPINSATGLVDQKRRLVHLYEERVFVEGGAHSQDSDLRHRGHEPYVGVPGDFHRSGHYGVWDGVLRRRFCVKNQLYLLTVNVA
jgi:hypothetical protein